MPVWGAANAYEITGSRTESYGRFEMTAKVTIVCPWENRDEVIDQVNRTPYPLPPIAAKQYYPAFPRTFEVSVWEESGKKTDIHEVSYSLAKIDIHYTCKQRNSAEQSVTQTCTPVLNMRRLPSIGFTWLSDNSPLTDAESPAMLQIMLKITRQVTGLRAIPDWWWSLAGCVNSTKGTDHMTKQQFEAETILFIPSSASKQVTTNPDDMEPVWDIGYELMWNPLGWNRFMRLDGLEISGVTGIHTDQISINRIPYRLYALGDFSLINTFQA
jgi:hypothetical protein